MLMMALYLLIFQILFDDPLLNTSYYIFSIIIIAVMPLYKNM
jgi:hypothetical protein